MNRKTAMVAAALFGAMLLGNTAFAQATASNDGEASLYDRLGGLMPASVVVSDFIDALIQDPQLNQNPAIDAARKRVPAAYLKYQVTAFVCMATGGPCDYTGREMEESHAHLNITPEEWDRMMITFRQVLATHEVPEREARELVELLGTTRDAIVSGG